jgi:cobalt/nickel transport system permease protein
MFILVATTEPGTLIASLRRLGMPRAFGMVLAMAQRYLVVILRAAEEIHLAKVSRTIQTASLSSEQHWVAAGAGILFRKTYRMAQDVYAAMISRGYDGDLQVGPAQGWRGREAGWLAAVGGVLVLLLLVDYWR